MAGFVDPHTDPSAAQRPSVLAGRHGLDELVGHFVLGRTLPSVPSAWSTSRLHGWRLAHDAALPARPLRDTRDEQVGWLLGHALDLDAGGLCETPVVSAAASDPGFAERFTEWLYAHGGRFAAVLVHPRARVYLDAYGSLPVLYDAARELVASSPFLFAEDDGTVRDSDLVDEFCVATGHAPHSFCLGLTPVAGVEQLTVNHELDLAAWAAERSWPVEPPETASAQEWVEAIGATLDRTITALAPLRPNVSLTAGGDSRLMLACARDVVADLSFFTVALPDAMGAVDARTAPRIAERFGLRHRVLPWQHPTLEDVERFLYRTGCMLGERRGRLAVATYAQLGGDRPYVSGISNFTTYLDELRWGSRDGLDMRVHTDDLVRRFYLPRHPEVERRIDAWLAEVPRMDALRTITLFNEERVTAWAGGLTFGYPEACTFTVYPSAHRSIGDAALRLDWRERMPHIRTTLTRARWPELLELGVNQWTVGERLGARAVRSYRLARAAARKAARLAFR